MHGRRPAVLEVCPLKTYEAMFMITGSEPQKNMDATEEHVRSIFEKCSCEVKKLERWKEQLKLAYDIKGASKGTYILAYFDGGPEAIDILRREFQLSEVVTRTLFLNVDEALVAKILAEPEPEPAAKSVAEESDSTDEEKPKVEEKVETPEEESKDKEDVPLKDEAETGDAASTESEESPSEDAAVEESTEAAADE